METKPIAYLSRKSISEQGTFGTLRIGTFQCFSLELPWKDNKNNISCIPDGTYQVKWTYSPRLKKETYEILGVPGRGGIRIHGGNLAGNEELGFISHSKGCPLLGSKIGTIQGQRAVLVSQPTVRSFISYMDRKPFTLVISGGHTDVSIHS